MSDTILIVGATSSIAKAVAHRFASSGSNLILAGRDETELSLIATDIGVRWNVNAVSSYFSALDYAHHDTFFADCERDHGPIRGVVVALGYLGDHALAKREFAEAETIFNTNFTACASLLNVVAHAFEGNDAADNKRERGKFICVISSVAGDRGRQSNYYYGAAKGALSIYLQGLRNRLHSSNVTVTTVKPGFVDTKMTFGTPGMFLLADPTDVAEGIHRAVQKRRHVVYLPAFWRGIMFIFRSIPETVFKRLRL